MNDKSILKRQPAVSASLEDWIYYSNELHSVCVKQAHTIKEKKSRITALSKDVNRKDRKIRDYKEEIKGLSGKIDKFERSLCYTLYKIFGFLCSRGQ